MIPLHERRILEAFVRKVSLTTLVLDNKPLDEYQHQELKILIRQRMKGMPIQYLIGNQSFYGREFYINMNVFIPRFETEQLVECALTQLSPHQEAQRMNVLEFGTGSGCIAITLALERPDLFITATECLPEAIAVAEENAQKFRVGNVDFLQVSEIPMLVQYEHLPLFDMIISNPPYLLDSDEISLEVRNHEPDEALYSHTEDGLSFYRFLAELVKTKLKPNGFAVCELATERAESTANVFKNYGFITQVYQDLSQRDRFVVVRR